MHKLMEYICNELDELERKADKEGKLSMAEIEYTDKLAHIKKSLLSAEEMWDDSEYNMDGDSSYANHNGNGGQTRMGGYSRRGSSYARGRRNARRDRMGRYSSNGYSMDGNEMISELRELMQDAPDEQTRMEFQRFISKIEQMQ